MIYDGSNDPAGCRPNGIAGSTTRSTDVPDEALPPPPKFLKAPTAQPDRHARAPIGRPARSSAAACARRRAAIIGLDPRAGMSSAASPHRGSPLAGSARAARPAIQSGQERRQRARPKPSRVTVDIPPDRHRGRSGHDADGGAGRGDRPAQQAQRHLARPRDEARRGDPGRRRDRAAARLRDDRAVGGAEADRRLRPARRPQSGGPASSGSFRAGCTRRRRRSTSSSTRSTTSGPRAAR